MNIKNSLVILSILHTFVGKAKYVFTINRINFFIKILCNCYEIIEAGIQSELLYEK